MSTPRKTSASDWTPKFVLSRVKLQFLGYTNVTRVNEIQFADLIGRSTGPDSRIRVTLDNGQEFFITATEVFT